MSGWVWVGVADLEPGDVVADFGEVAHTERHKCCDEVLAWFVGDDPDDNDDAAKWDIGAMVQVKR